MSPELFTQYTARHSRLVEELTEIEDVFEVVARKIISIHTEHRNRFRSTVERYVNPGFNKIGNSDSIKFTDIDEDEVRITFTIDGYDGDADEEIDERFSTKLFSDYYFDRAAFDKYFEDEYSNLVAKHNNTLKKNAEAVKRAEYQKFLELKKTFEGGL